MYFVTDCIMQLANASYDYPNDIVSAGSVYFAPQGWRIEDAAIYEKAGDYTPPNHFQDAIGWVAPYIALWEKEWIVELGGWDEQFPGYWGWDDIDLLTRLRINGHGQYIDLEIKALHQFHGLGGDKDFVNEGYFRAKSFNACEEEDETKMTEDDLKDLVANKNIEWGKIKNK
jgi:GT2 family glycosyltransferase